MNETSKRQGDWMQTHTGRQFWPLDPRAEEVSIEDIAHALSLQCRFAGHCKSFYSVAEHSVRVSKVIGEAAAGPHTAVLALAGLLHDAAEAYVVDVPRPLKRFLDGYKGIEGAVARCVEQRFGLPAGATEWGVVKLADEALLATEARDLMGPRPAPWGLGADPLAERIVPWTPEEAERRFLERFTHLTGQKTAVECVVLLVTMGAAVLAIRSAKPGRAWELPGGKVNTGETELAAARRECIEETGITPTDLRVVKTLDGAPKPGADFASRIHVVAGTSAISTTVAGDDAIEAAWLTAGEVFTLQDRGRLSDLASRDVLLSWASSKRAGRP